MNIAILLAYRAVPDLAKVGVFPQLRSLKVKPDYIAILLHEVMFKVLTGHFYAEGKVFDQFHSYNCIYITKWLF